MKLIIALGNPGKEYAKTRHNAGFLFADHLRGRRGFDDFKTEKKFSSLISAGMIGTEKAIIVKPETFMNESGTAVRSLIDFYKLSPSDIAVIHDDLDIIPGTFRTTDSSRAAGHNGVQDIIGKLGTQDFFRIRIGIGKPVDVLKVCMPSHDYVLGAFSAEELTKLEAAFPEIETTLTDWIKR